jgi:hypothetical protein
MNNLEEEYIKEIKNDPVITCGTNQSYCSWLEDKVNELRIKKKEMTDLERFIELYKSIGIDCAINEDDGYYVVTLVQLNDSDFLLMKRDQINLKDIMVFGQK